jgi:hypothetical protein
MPEEYGLPYAFRPYYCTSCGNEEMVQTNHTGLVFARCGDCSWRGGWDLERQAWQHPGTRLFRYGHSPYPPRAEGEEPRPEEPTDKELGTDINFEESISSQADRLLERPGTPSGKRRRHRLPPPKAAEMQVSFT